jgi:hypothetical protein
LEKIWNCFDYRGRSPTVRPQRLILNRQPGRFAFRKAVAPDPINRFAGKKMGGRKMSWQAHKKPRRPGWTGGVIFNSIAPPKEDVNM